MSVKGDGEPFEAGRARAVGAAIAAAQVGGSFWDPPIAPVRVLQVDRYPRNGCDYWAAILQADRIEGDLFHPAALLALCAGRKVYAPDGHRVEAEEADRLLHAALLRGVAYRNPWTGVATSIDEAVAVLALWREVIDANRGIATVAGIARWKRPAMDRFLWRGGAGSPSYDGPETARQIAKAQKGAIAVWPSRVPPDFVSQTMADGLAIVQIEDGFIRSTGLGSDLLPPLSVVIDNVGIYYDPHVPSRLERLLANSVFTPELLDRAARLRADVVDRGIGKYGRSDGGSEAVLSRTHDVVLVVGQVEDDRSVALGGGGITSNEALLKAVRHAEPGAHIVFRPHPDVEAGHRPGHLSDARVLAFADGIDRGTPLAGLLRQVDRVHVLSSLTGFEALLRDKDVVVHGQPFYAGWGLTTDLAAAIPRRSRRLTLDELVAATLILYPRYVDPVTGLPCTPEILLRHLPVAAARRPSMLVRARRLQGRLRKRFRLSYGNA